MPNTIRNEHSASDRTRRASSIAVRIQAPTFPVPASTPRRAAIPASQSQYRRTVPLRILRRPEASEQARERARAPRIDASTHQCIVDDVDSGIDVRILSAPVRPSSHLRILASPSIPIRVSVSSRHRTISAYSRTHASMRTRARCLPGKERPSYLPPYLLLSTYCPYVLAILAEPSTKLALPTSASTSAVAPRRDDLPSERQRSRGPRCSMPNARCTLFAVRCSDS
ncbi:hypothetical protein GY45DRAFT_1368376 [Cubamyces sp. BRFM 1775]|nr:hypothetical protein GY45DRAFT_1368376 [Cubamyces sp. BRFM 1775]